MRKPSVSLVATLTVIISCVGAPAVAQFRNGNQTVHLNLPRVSQRAVVTQRIGLTDITILYHRPQTEGRKIFGDLVPYGRVWRAGANDNTIVEITHTIVVEGQPLAAGRYGIHMIPGESEWTVIFSKNSTSWGSFYYNPNEDALRVKVKPNVAPSPRDALTYEFSNLKSDGATIALLWDKVVVPFSVSVDTKSITLDSLRKEMRHLPGYKAETFYEAAMYCLDNNFNYDEALKWVDQAIEQAGERFENLDLKSQLLERGGRQQEASELLARALKLGSPQQLFGYGDRLLREKKLADANAFFTDIAAKHPEVWLNWYGLARTQIAQGDRAAAKRSLEKAQEVAAQPGQKGTIRRMLERLAAGQGIG